jgi:hypothetical protein
MKKLRSLAGILGIFLGFRCCFDSPLIRSLVFVNENVIRIVSELFTRASMALILEVLKLLYLREDQESGIAHPVLWTFEDLGNGFLQDAWFLASVSHPSCCTWLALGCQCQSACAFDYLLLVVYSCTIKNRRISCLIAAIVDTRDMNKMQENLCGLMLVVESRIPGGGRSYEWQGVGEIYAVLLLAALMG